MLAHARHSDFGPPLAIANASRGNPSGGGEARQSFTETQAVRVAILGERVIVSCDGVRVQAFWRKYGKSSIINSADDDGLKA